MGRRDLPAENRGCAVDSVDSGSSSRDPGLPHRAASETAVFAVSEVTDEAVVKELTAALAKQEGVVSAKADAEGGKFRVTFETSKTNAETLTETVAGVAPDSKFEKVEPATVAKHDCSKCPSKASCSKAK